MDFHVAKALIDIMSSADMPRAYTLIGGEPLMHPKLDEIIVHLTSYTAKVGIMTNGIALCDKGVCRRLKNSSNGKVRLNISLKGISDEEYACNCGTPAFSKVLHGIRQAEAEGMIVSCSYVISEHNVKGLVGFARKYRDLGLGHLPLSFSQCADVILDEPNSCKREMTDVMIDRCFNSQYEEINDILDGNFSLHQSLPLCACEPEIISKMESRRQLFTACHLMQENGLVFDTNGGILFCNHLVGTTLGKYGADYSDAASFKAFFESDAIQNYRHLLCTMPDAQCNSCMRASLCGGGCTLRWLSKNFSDLRKELKEYKLSPYSIIK